MTTFLGTKDFKHDVPEVTGILLVNMGTPQAPTAKALRPYLREFLGDPRVIEMNRVLWWSILNFVVLPFRPRRSARLYAKIWTKEGSPLLLNSQKQLQALERSLRDTIRSSVAVELGMRYGKPSIADALEKLRARGLSSLLILPLYPQYSGTTTGSTFDSVVDVLKHWRVIPQFRFIAHYHDHPLYIQSVASCIKEAWQITKQPEKLLMSFHGIPQRYVLSGDPYFSHCMKTGRLIAEALGLQAERYAVCFQSLFGREEWLKPYTNDTLLSWARAGVKSVDVVCPGFTSDCLETIEEIDAEYRELFLNAGGKEFHYIPAVNDDQGFIDALMDIVLENTPGWAVGRGGGLGPPYCDIRIR